MTGVLTGSPERTLLTRSVGRVSTSDDIREFLTSRRARITPDNAGLPAYGRNRRVPGLRREEVAMLAGISVEYYTKLERGNATGVSESVFEGLARALQLDDAERTYLAALLQTSGSPRPRRPRPAKQRIRPAVQRLLDSMAGVPAYVRNGRFDILAANALGEALYAPLYEDPARPVNSARSEVFRTRWADHDVRFHRSGTKRFRHPLIGDVTLDFEAFEISADPGLRLNTYTAAPDSPSAEALGLLASWVNTPVERTAVRDDH